MKKAASCALIAATVFSAGCASIIKGTDQAITINSEPEGAVVSIDGRSVGTTPLVTKLKKNDAEVISVKKDGYRAQTMPLEKSYDGIALLNVFWDLSTTDAATGAIYEYSPSTYYFKLVKEDGNQ